MIQRIQSIYLLLTTIMSVLFLKGSFLKFINNAGSELAIDFMGINQMNNEKGFELVEQMIPLTVIFILIPLISFLAIFLFKKRRLQLRITLIVIILALLLIMIVVYYVISVIHNYQVILIPGIKMFLLPLILLFALLAYRRIRKDEDLVKSYDRLR